MIIFDNVFLDDCNIAINQNECNKLQSFGNSCLWDGYECLQFKCESFSESVNLCQIANQKYHCNWETYYDNHLQYPSYFMDNVSFCC